MQVSRSKFSTEGRTFDWRKISTYLLLLGFYCLVFVPVLRSGYMYDDLLNFPTKGWCINNDKNVMQMSLIYSRQWVCGGRLFPFSTYGYEVYYFLGNVVAYKIYLVLTTFLVGVLLSNICYKLTDSNKIRLFCMVLYPILVSLDCSYYNAMYGFCALTQLTCIYVFGAILLFFKYSESGLVRFQVLSCILLSIGLGTYEVAYALCLIFAVVSYAIYKKTLVAVKKILPQIITGCSWLALNIIVRILSKSTYSGVTVSFSKDTLFGFLKQLTGISSFGNWWLLSQRSADISSALAENYIRYILVIAAVIALVVMISRKEEKSPHGLKYLLMISSVLILIPTFLISISSRYQIEVTWGKGYLLAYISCWGVVILGSILLTRSKKHKIARIILVVVLCSLTVVNQTLADITESQTSVTYDYISFVGDAANAGLLDDYNSDAVLVDNTKLFSLFPNDSWAYYLNKKVSSISFDSLYETEADGSVMLTDACENYRESDFNYVYYQYDSYVVNGHANGIIITQEENSTERVEPIGVEARIYIPVTSSISGISSINKSGDYEYYDLDELEMISQSSNGKVYYIRFSEEINLNSINVIENFHEFQGDGSKENPYQISTAEDLAALADFVNSGRDYEDIYFQQVSDIDLSEYENWTPIGAFGTDTTFAGTYDGGGHTISNLNISGGNVGLFGCLSGTVCNLGIESGYISGGCVGSIASHSYAPGAMIINCYNRATIVGAARAGGIADNFDGGMILGCLNLGAVTVIVDNVEVPSVGICSYAADVVYGCYSLEETVPEGFIGSVESCNIVENANIEVLNDTQSDIMENFDIDVELVSW